MGTETQRWTVGAARVTSVVEDENTGIPPEFFFPDATAEVVAEHGWLVPDFAGADGTIGLRVQAFVIEVGHRTILVDPCVGNGKPRGFPFWSEQQWPFMDRFDAAGLVPEAVDTVVHTHLHADHVGWDTQLVDGSWVPTFSAARHLYTQAEIDWVQSAGEPAGEAWDDSIEPIFVAGLADIVDDDADLGDGLRLEPTPGHTPGHASVWLTSEGETALITGDILHHPVQTAVPEWAEIGDVDADLARETRRRMFTRAADTGALVLGTHFPSRPAGRIVVDGDAWRFEAV